MSMICLIGLPGCKTRTENSESSFQGEKPVSISYANSRAKLMEAKDSISQRKVSREIDGFTVGADKIEFESDETVVLTGNVVVASADGIAMAERARIQKGEDAVATMTGNSLFLLHGMVGSPVDPQTPVIFRSDGAQQIEGRNKLIIKRRS